MAVDKKHFLIEWSSYEAYDNFLSGMMPYIESARIFQAGIGQFYLTVFADFDDNCETGKLTFTDFLNDYRKKGITVLREYMIKPSPQRYWAGEWKIIC